MASLSLTLSQIFPKHISFMASLSLTLSQIFPKHISFGASLTLSQIFPKHISFMASLFLSLRFANEIESGRVELQSYSNESSLGWETESKKSQTSFGSTAKTKHGEVERKKGTPWREEEHRTSVMCMAS
ncbi:hypothetical protein HYC85_018310 [Camellia sinensis]|uniref:Uncharacterized protein n=1 Tax=Camellia sinensis TaxID=4442 RepID=A0A7J7GTZ3_CAMSI|nr:hypothetical protein HYC85_018310 [Camellia sinensis]